MDLIEDKCLPLQNKVTNASKYLKEYIEKVKKFNILDGKRKELVETLKIREKKSLIDISLFAKHVTVQRTILDNYRKLMNENSSEM